MPRCSPIACEAPAARAARRADDRGDLGAGLEQPRGLAVDDLEVALLGGVRVARIHELQHLALGDDVGGLGHDLDDALRAHRRHHLEGARVDEIPHQHAGLVAEHLVGGVAAAAQRRHVDHVVVQQRGGMDELDEGRRLDVRVRWRGAVGGPAGRAAGPAGEHHEQGPQPFAAARR